MIVASIRWSGSTRQGATLKVVKSSIDASMKWPLLISMTGLWLLYAANVLMRARTEVLSRNAAAAGCAGWSVTEA